MAWSINTTITGSPSEDDERAALMLIAAENERRAALDPPENPLPFGNAGQIRTSANTLVDQMWGGNAWASYVQQANTKEAREIEELVKGANNAKRAAAKAPLTS